MSKKIWKSPSFLRGLQNLLSSWSKVSTHSLSHFGPKLFQNQNFNYEWVEINVRLVIFKSVSEKRKTLSHPDTIVSSTKQSGYSSVVHCAALAAGTVERSFKLFSTNSIDSVSSIYRSSILSPIYCQMLILPKTFLSSHMVGAKGFQGHPSCRIWTTMTSKVCNIVNNNNNVLPPSKMRVSSKIKYLRCRFCRSSAQVFFREE